MDINIITNELILRIPAIAKVIRFVKLQHYDSQDFVALLYNDIIFYTDKLFSEFDHEKTIIYSST